MSHFSVAVITDKKPSKDEIAEILAPYQENNMDDVPAQYLQFSPIDDDTLSDYKDSYMNDLQECSNAYIKDVATFEEYMRDNGYEYDKETKEYGYYYNPNAKWDWWVIGGRWSGSLIVSNNCDSEQGEKSWIYGEDNPYKTTDKQYKKCDIARIKDLVFPNKEKEEKKSARFWEVYIDGYTPKNEEEAQFAKNTFYKKEYYIDRYKTKENFIEYDTTVLTYAIITKDGTWHAQGEMGWFGISSSETDTMQWLKYFKDVLKKGAEDDSYITIVDCHI